MDDPTLLAATRFSVVIVLLTTALCYGAFIARQFLKKKRAGTHTLLAVAVTLEMGASGSQQAYWWLVEMAMAHDNCTAADRFRGVACPSTQAIVQYDAVTHFFYMVWIAGAMIVMGLFLSAIDRRFSDWRYLSVLMLISVIGLWLMGYSLAREA